MERNMETERLYATDRLYAVEEAGRQALGLVGRAESADFTEAFNNFKMAYGFLKKEFKVALSTEITYDEFLEQTRQDEEASTSDVADPEKEPNV